MRVKLALQKGAFTSLLKHERSQAQHWRALKEFEKQNVIFSTHHGAGCTAQARALYKLKRKGTILVVQRLSDHAEITEM
jgi:hypothetical protein